MYLNPTFPTLFSPVDQRLSVRQREITFNVGSVGFLRHKSAFLGSLGREPAMHLVKVGGRVDPALLPARGAPGWNVDRGPRVACAPQARPERRSHCVMHLNSHSDVAERAIQRRWRDTKYPSGVADELA